MKKKKKKSNRFEIISLIALCVICVGIGITTFLLIKATTENEQNHHPLIITLPTRTLP